jgi:hypothetical protein
VPELSQMAGLERHALGRHFRRAGLSSPRAVLDCLVGCEAFDLVLDGGQSLARIGRSLGHRGGPAFRRTLRRVYEMEVQRAFREDPWLIGGRIAARATRPHEG